MNSLGKILKNRREELRLTLRDVEKKIGISNAYLSQLENEKILQPTPRILRKLSENYSLSYTKLLELAGHPTLSYDSIKHRVSVFDNITPNEEKELKEYLLFMRRKRST